MRNIMGEHIIFDCNRWEAERQRLMAVNGNATCVNVIDKMMVDDVPTMKEEEKEY